MQYDAFSPQSQNRMPEYFYTATDRNSHKRETNCIEAASAQEAVHDLKTAGYDEIVLNTDDIDAILNNTIPDQFPVDNIFSDSEQIAIQHSNNLQLFLLMLKKSCWYLRWLILLALTLFFISWYEPKPVDPIKVNFGLFLLLLPVGMALKASFFSPLVKYKQMYEALNWGDWNTVLKIVPKIQNYRSAIETGTIKASALAHLGKLDEGLKIMHPFSSSQEIPHWIYLIELAKVYEYGNLPEQSLKCVSKAYLEASENPTVLHAYANLLIKQNKDPALAWKLIQAAEACPKSDRLEQFLFLSKGQFELKQGRYKDALQILQEVKQQLLPLSHSQPEARLHLDFCDAWTAIALAELGEREEAERLYQSALPRLEALNSTQIIERYQQAVLGNKT